MRYLGFWIKHKIHWRFGTVRLVCLVLVWLPPMTRPDHSTMFTSFVIRRDMLLWHSCLPLKPFIIRFVSFRFAAHIFHKNEKERRRSTEKNCKFEIYSKKDIFVVALLSPSLSLLAVHFEWISPLSVFASDLCNEISVSKTFICPQFSSHACHMYPTSHTMLYRETERWTKQYYAIVCLVWLWCGLVRMVVERQFCAICLANFSYSNWLHSALFWCHFLSILQTDFNHRLLLSVQLFSSSDQQQPKKSDRNMKPISVHTNAIFIWPNSFRCNFELGQHGRFIRKIVVVNA